MRNNLTNFRVFGPDETASNRLQAIYEVTQEDLDGRPAAGGRRRRRALPGRPGDGDALRAHAARLAGGLPAHGPPRLLPHLRGLRPRHRLDVQPARQVAGHLQEPRALACVGGLPEHPALLHRLAPGPQRLLAPGPGLHRPGHQQESERHAHLPAARRQHACWRWPTTACARPTASTSSSPTSRSTCSSPPSTRRSCTAPRASASGAGPAPTRVSSPTWCWPPAATCATLEALAAAAILRERLPDLKLRFVNVVDLFKMQPASEHPHGLDRPRVRQPVHHRQADHLQLPRLSLADPQAGLPLHEPREPARAGLQGEGQHQHAARAGDPQPDRPLQPGHRRDRPGARPGRPRPRT